MSAAATARKPRTSYKRVELYVGYIDHTWRAGHFVYVPTDLMQGWGDEVTIGEAASAAYQRYMDHNWGEVQRASIAFIGLYSVSDTEPYGDDARPSKDDIQVTPRDVKKAANERSH